MGLLSWLVGPSSVPAAPPAVSGAPAEGLGAGSRPTASPTGSSSNWLLPRSERGAFTYAVECAAQKLLVRDLSWRMFRDELRGLCAGRCSEAAASAIQDDAEELMEHQLTWFQFRCKLMDYFEPQYAHKHGPTGPEWRPANPEQTPEVRGA